MLQKLSTVPYEETKYLVKKFFQKVIDLKEIEQKKHVELCELQMQLEEQTRLVEQLKHVLTTASSSDIDRRLIETKAKAEKTQKQLVQQLNECTARMAVMEKEIVLYKEKLHQLKVKSSVTGATQQAAAPMHESSSKHFAELDNASSFLSERNKSVSSSAINASSNKESFFLKNNNSNISSNNNIFVADSNMELDASKMVNGIGANASSTARTVKVSRKDLRRLNEDELVQRNLKKEPGSS